MKIASSEHISSPLPSFNRRLFLSHGSALVAHGLLASALSGQALAKVGDAMTAGEDYSSGKEVIAQTSFGKIRGLQMSDGVRIFRGVPYGADTSGPNRFMPPKRPDRWSGIRPAMEWGPKAPQLPQIGSIEAGLTTGNIDLPGRRGEDCLVLNIWTKAGRDGGKRPVMVRIHGGGFGANTGNNPKYWGHATVLRGDVVYITLNHRLGSLGFLDLSEIGGPAYAQSGNVGMLDLVAALEWVQDNAEYFGGDPDRVMIWGESGGGEKISTLMGMPSAKGLFHRAVIESGARLRAITRDQSRQVAERFLGRLGLDRTRLEELHSLPLWRLMEAQAATSSRLYPEDSHLAGFGSVVDGQVVPDHMFDPVASSISADVPLVIGTNRHEATYELQRDPEFHAMDDGELRSRVEKIVGTKADRVVAAYREVYRDASPTDLLVHIVTDIGSGGYDPKQRREAIRLGERKAALRRAPVYMYRFDWESPAFDGKLGAMHGAEDAFFMDTVTYESVLTHHLPQAYQLAAKINALFIAFARTGIPKTSDFPVWPHYEATTRSTMLFNYESRVENDPEGSLRQLWAEL